ncbi:hypothetical protein I5K89_23330 [Serratia marcescens]|nr:hypothetical protein [Serratia marcescens]
MVLRFELALRAATVRLHQSVVGVVAVVLFVQAIAPADQVAPGVVTVKQFLPVRQPVVGNRRQRQVRVDVVLRAAGYARPAGYPPDRKPAACPVCPDWARGVTADCLLYNKYLEY